MEGENAMPEAATRKQVVDFNTLRAAGVPVARAAEYVGRKTSWGYQQEQKRKLTGGEPSALPVRDGAGEVPSWSEAVELIVAIDSHDFDAPGPSLADRYGAQTVAVAWVAAYLAGTQARTTQDYLLEIHEDEEWWDEVKNDPVTTEDILRAVPDAIEKREHLFPDRAKKWDKRLVAEHPDLLLIAEERAKAEDSDDPDEAHRDLRRRIKAGDFDPEHLREPIAVNGHH